MTYYYKVRGTITEKIGGSPPPVSEYAAIDPSGVVRHIKNEEIIEEHLIKYPEHVPYFSERPEKIKNMYKKAIGYTIAKNMLSDRKKKSSKKGTSRKHQKVKK